MSASNPNSAIYVTDTPKQIKLKVHLQTNEWLESEKRAVTLTLLDYGVFLEVTWFSCNILSWQCANLCRLTSMPFLEEGILLRSSENLGQTLRFEHYLVILHLLVYY
jgi:hypothetical protein